MDYFETYYAVVACLLIMPTISSYVYHKSNNQFMINMDKLSSPRLAKLIMRITSVSAFFGFWFVLISAFVVGGFFYSFVALVAWSVINVSIGNKIEYRSRTDSILYFVSPISSIAAWVVFFINL